MSVFMLLASGGARLITEAITASRNWTAPAGTTRLVKLAGQGAAGTTSYTKYTHIVTARYKTAGGIDYVESDQDGWVNPSGSDYCDPAQPDSGIYYQYIQCFYHRTRTDTTTGAATTGFSKTFPGGTGGAASPAAYNDVPVTPGQSYPLSVPTGGSLTLTYYAQG